jgi:periplasmic protein TonB
LKTLDKYIEAHSAEGRFGLSGWYESDRRFARLLALSVVGHIIFYAVLIHLDPTSNRNRSAGAERRTELVKIIEVAPAPTSLRRGAVEPIERADINRLKFDPAEADDEHLIERSPKRGNPHATRSTPLTPKPSVAPKSASPAPPSPAPMRTDRSAPQSPTAIAQPAQTQPQPAPSPAVQNPTANLPRPGAESAQRDGRGEQSQGTKDFGLQSVQSQYLAYVRVKISKTNERIMPRKWIEDILADKVSADFAVLLGRGGRILSARLARSTGYSQLDDVAKQAIYIASPYEGYPPEAGETITLTVTVYYTPWR